MKVKIEELIINPEYEQLLFPLSDVDFNNLEQSILKDGVIYPIIINPDNVILDGHHRTKICEKHSITEIDFLTKSFEDDLDEKEFVVTCNLNRRHLNEVQRAEIALLLKGIEAEKAQRREKATQFKGIFSNTITEESKMAESTLTQPYNKSEEKYEEEKGRTLEKLAKMVGLSYGTLFKAEKIKEEAEKDLEIKEDWEEAKRGEKKKGKRLSIDGIFKSIDRKKKEQKKQEEYHVSNHAIGHIVHGDSTILLDKIEDASYDLLLTDPPYITDIDDYEGFLRKWLPKAMKKIKDTGRIYIFCSSHPDELFAYLKVIKDSDLNGFTLANFLVWLYQNNIGPAPTHTFKRGWQGIFYLYGKNAPKWDEPLTKDIFDHFGYSMPDGRQEIKYHSHQKPEPLIEQLIVLSSKPNDRILDLFAGSGEIGLTASKLNRYCLSIEIEKDLVETCKQRGLIEYEY